VTLDAGGCLFARRTTAEIPAAKDNRPFGEFLAVGLFIEFRVIGEAVLGGLGWKDGCHESPRIYGIG